MIHNGEYYVYPQETWDEAECKKRASHGPKDHWGNRPPKGLISHIGSTSAEYGQRHRYNGGCICAGDWWEGEERPLPIIPDTYEFVLLSSWGTRIQRKADGDA